MAFLVEMIVDGRVVGCEFLKTSHPTDPVSPDLRRKHRPKSSPPKPHLFMTDFDPTIVQQVFYISQRQRKANVEHHSEADDFR